MTAGAVASAPDALPRVATYYVAALERAGLVRRERDSQHVRALRVAPGTALAAMCDG